MKDFDIIDRKYTTITPMQTVLVLLVMVPFLMVTMHANPAVGYWMAGQTRLAVWIAIFFTGIPSVLLGFLFPVISVARGEMSRRGLLVSLVIFGALALLFLVPIVIALPHLLSKSGSRMSTFVNTYYYHVFFSSTFAAYTTGFAAGCGLALRAKRLPPVEG